MRFLGLCHLFFVAQSAANRDRHFAGLRSCRQTFGIPEGGWRATRNGARYGCFLPDLTGLASVSSVANLPAHYIRPESPRGKGGKSRIRVTRWGRILTLCLRNGCV